MCEIDWPKQTLKNITNVIRKLFKERGQSIPYGSRKYFQQGLIFERDYKLLKALSLSADKDAGIIK